jgi:hypothetical protein
MMSTGGAVHVEDIQAGFGFSALKHDPVGFHPLHPAEPDDVFDLPQELKLAGAEHGAAEHRRRPRGVNPREPPCGLQPLEEVLDARRTDVGLGVRGRPLDDWLTRPHCVTGSLSPGCKKAHLFADSGVEVASRTIQAGRVQGVNFARTTAWPPSGQLGASRVCR